MAAIKLSINRGVPQLRDDGRSLEEDENDSLSLVNANGISATQWTPQFAQVKGNAVYADTPTSDGRIPLAQSYGDVTETITVSMRGASASDLAYLQTRLNRLREEVRAFWTSNWQVFPVVLEWEFVPNKPQFALIKKLDVAWSVDAFETEQRYAEAVITIERGYAWHGISPGDNPRRWSYIVGSGEYNFRNSVASLLSTSNNLFSATTMKNFMAWNTAHSPYREESTENFIDIPAASVPGDLPALVQFVLQAEHPTSAVGYTQLFVWRSSRALSVTDRNGTQYAVSYNLYGDTAKSGVSSTFTVTSAETSFVSKKSWTSDVATPNTDLWHDKTLLRGKYVVFARMQQASGTAGDVRARVKIADQGSAATNTVIAGNEVRVNITNALHYMGVFNIPLAERVEVSPFGNGLMLTNVPTAGVGNIPYNIGIFLECRNTAGANRDVNFYDLVLMPIDECATLLQAPTFTASGAYMQFLYDTTGYFDRGKGEPIAKLITGSAAVTSGGPSPDSYGGEPVEVRGAPITLLPNTDQRLYFMVNTPAAAVPFTTADQNVTLKAYINIVPRWLNIRDR